MKALKNNLQKARVRETHLLAKLREANVSQLSQIKAVIFETTGDMSVLYSDSNEKVDDWIMQGVDS